MELRGIRREAYYNMREAAMRVIRLYEAWGKYEKATEWKAKLGMPDLPVEVFAQS
jgi:hypothetical protein